MQQEQKRSYRFCSFFGNPARATADSDWRFRGRPSPHETIRLFDLA